MCLLNFYLDKEKEIIINKIKKTFKDEGINKKTTHNHTNSNIGKLSKVKNDGKFYAKKYYSIQSNRRNSEKRDRNSWTTLFSRNYEEAGLMSTNPLELLSKFIIEKQKTSRRFKNFIQIIKYF